MPSYDSGRVSTIGGLNIKARRTTDLTGIRFDANRASIPSSTNDFILFRHGNALKVWDGTSTITLVAGGAVGGGAPSWETLFASDTTFNVAGTTWTIDNSTGNNDVLTITNSGTGSGDCIQITNVGTGNDIQGTSNTWAVTKAGVATFVGVSLSGTTNAITTTADVTWTLEDNDSTAMIIGASGSTTMMTFDTLNTGPTVRFGNDVTVTDGLATFISTSNTAANLMITNNTITTFGVTQAASAGIVVIRSTSLTTGTMLRLQASNTAMTSGFYLECMDSVGGGATEFSIGEDGTTVIAGTAAGTAALTLTTGNIVVSSGAVSITRAGDAVNLTVTNNTATTASVVAITGSGIHTGTTTTSFMTITQSGTTAGTMLYLVAAAAATSVAVVDLVTLGLTSGSALRIASTTAVFTTGGKLIELTSAAAVAGNLLTATTTGAYTGTGLVVLSAGAFTTGIGGLSVVNSGTAAATTGSQIRTSINGTGAIATNGIISFTHTGAFTSTSAVDGGFVEVKANSTTAGTIVNVIGTALTTGIALQLSNATSAMTTGSLLRVTTSGTGTIATNGIVSITHGGIYLSTSNAGVLDVRATALVGAGTVVNFVSSAASQTAARILNITQSGATITGYTGTIASFTGNFTGAGSTGTIIGLTAVSDVAGDALKITNTALTLGAGTLVNLSHTTSVIGAGSSMLRITSTGVNTGTTTGTMLDVAATAATSAVLMLVTSATLDSGKALLMNLNGLTTGAGLHIAHTTSVIAAGGSLARLSSTSVDTSTTTGSLLDLSSTTGAIDTKILGTFAGHTSGTVMRMNAAGTTSGTIYLAEAVAATLTTGSYFRAFDGTNSVFAIKLGGHISSAGTVVSAVVGAGAGTTPSAVTATSTTDSRGTLTVTTGTSTPAGTVITATFAKTYSATPYVFITPANANTAAVMVSSKIVASAPGSTTFTIVSTTTGLTDATAYSWNYFVIE